MTDQQPATSTGTAPTTSELDAFLAGHSTEVISRRLRRAIDALQQPKAQEHQAQESQHQAQQRQQPQNQAQPGQQSGNENSNQNGSQNTAENPGQGEIRQIQQALEHKGFKLGRPDGKLGPMTKRALSQFQRKQGLRETGTPDEQTLAALGIGGGASTTGQGTSGSGGTNPSQAPSNNPTAQPPQQQPTGRR